MASDTRTAETHSFQAEIARLLDLIVNSLYSHKEIFLRELISNASDALDRLAFRALTEPELLGDDAELEIRILPDPEAGTLTIEDNGIGMTREEVIANLGTIARSGSREFLEALASESERDVSLIGRFGVGFYSAFLVADRVTVSTRSVEGGEAVRWESDARGTFTVGPDERTARGTAVTLHLREDQREYLEPARIRELVRTYSDYVGHPIRLRLPSTDSKGKEASFETINTARALWRRPKSEIEPEQLEEFYRHLTHDWNPPLAWTHFQVEGQKMFTGLLFIPKEAPIDLFLPEGRRGIRLFVQRVFIMDDCKELIPEYLRFVRGIVDSDDLPLNVSRELLQESADVRFIRKHVTRKVLELLERLAEEEPESYETFWNRFGRILKEGIHADPANRDRIAKLLRYDSTLGEKPVSLDAYIAAMPEEQRDVYYITGESRKALEKSPHIEALRERGFPVLFWTDPVDEWVAMSLPEYQGRKLVDVTRGDLELGPKPARKEEKEEPEPEREARADEPDRSALCERIRKVLGDRVQEVRVSKRLTESPVCLVTTERGIPAHLERILKATNQTVGLNPRILEIHPTHPIIEKLEGLTDDASFSDWVELLYGQALLTEGSPLPDPADFSRRIASLMLQLS